MCLWGKREQASEKQSGGLAAFLGLGSVSSSCSPTRGIFTSQRCRPAPACLLPSPRAQRVAHSCILGFHSIPAAGC